MSPQTASIPIIILTAKQLTPLEREQLHGQVLQVMEKSEFNHGNFINEVKRALGRSQPATSPPGMGKQPRS